MVTETECAEHVTRRPPILQATRALGIRDVDVAHICGVSPVAVNQWANGQRPIPRVKHVALLLIVGFIREMLVDTDHPRVAAACEIVLKWLILAREEVGEHPDEVFFAALSIANQFTQIYDDPALLARFAAEAASLEAEDETGPEKAALQLKAALAWLNAVKAHAEQHPPTPEQIEATLDGLAEVRKLAQHAQEVLDRKMRGAVQPRQRRAG
jgi:hypothetical protein